MPEHNDSGKKKTRNSIKTARKASQSMTSRTSWAHWMQGAEPLWFHSMEAKEIERTFGARHPLWLIQSAPWKPVTPERFRIMRTSIMHLSIEQCATYLRVHRATVSRWEAGEGEVPFAAYEALRLQAETNIYKMSHRVWDGWFIDQKSGALISPNNAKIAVLPTELNSLLNTYSRLSSLEIETKAQQQQINELEAENAALRGNQKVRAVAAELTDMQAKIADLLQSIQTAEIHHFPSAALPARAAIGA